MIIAPITDIFSNISFLVVGQAEQNILTFLLILSAGSALTGGFPLLTSRYFEFSFNRIFILSLFLLRPEDPTAYFALASLLAGAILRRTVSGREFWRYMTGGFVMIALLRFSPMLIRILQPGIMEQIAIISILPILIVFEIIITISFADSSSDFSKLAVRILVSYIAVIPLAIMTLIMVFQEGILGAALATGGLSAFSFVGSSINRKHLWNTERIKEISRQDSLATHLMDSSSYGEFISILQNNLYRDSDSRIHTLTRSSGVSDWVLWSTDEHFVLKESGITGTIPEKGSFSSNIKIKNISSIALGLSDTRDLIIVLSGPERNILQNMPSGLLENFIQLLGHTWEAVGHSLRSERSFLAAAVTLARLADSKDDYTHGHSLRVASLSCLLGNYLHLSPENIQTLRVAAILHDIGKLAIPASILTKRGLLTKKEREIVEAHPLEGARIVSGLSGYDKVARIIRSHHERLDGMGYPDGLCNGEIPFMARIIAVADTFDAITSDRSYHSISGWDNALETIKEETGSKFDYRIVTELEAILADESMSMA